MRPRVVLATCATAAVVLTASPASAACAQADSRATLAAAIAGTSPHSTPGDLVFIGRVVQVGTISEGSRTAYSPRVELQVEAVLKGRVPTRLETRNPSACYSDGTCAIRSEGVTLRPGQRMAFLTKLTGRSFTPPSGCGGDVWGLTTANARRIAAKYQVAFTEVPDSAIDYVVPKAPRPTPTPVPVTAPTAERRNTAVPTAIAALLVLVMSAALGALRRLGPRA